jgi:hypothetical protein
MEGDNKGEKPIEVEASSDFLNLRPEQEQPDEENTELRESSQLKKRKKD